MRLAFTLLVSILASLMSPRAAAAAADAQPLPHANLIVLDNQIMTPVTSGFIGDAIRRSETDGAACLIIMLDTPGGLLESTREIVKAIMNARVPVVVFVAPPGARAASAGVFITLSAHVAAMAPSTHIGAAHPVTMGEGEGIKPLVPQENQPPPTTDTMSRKVMNDTVAWIEGIARARGRNVDWAKRAVTESVSIGEDEAVKLRVVDFIAANTDDLLAKLNGREVALPDGTRRLATQGVRLDTIAMNWVQRVLAVVVHPNVAYILMMLGILGLIFEFTTSTFGFSGVFGLICLLLAFYAFHVLPVNYAALALILLGLGLIIAEVKIVSHGLLAIGGTISLVLGSMLLFESPAPSLRVSLPLILMTVGTMAAIVLLLVWRAVRAQAWPAATGAAGMIGETGKAATALSPDGQVFVHGEIWNATATEPIEQGSAVRIVQVDGLHVTVEPIKVETRGGA